ncbi:hypothetical protein ACIA8C_31930 [Nocardia sp. NPDC051321]|uniref:hypothetical protein n=1 Tax=Nocardia sp. NPDC051321 TaxID=3364323 RepID=UPI0037B1FEAC
MRDEQSTGSSEIAALAQRVETARGKLPLQHDAALFEVLSEGEIGAERELAEWVRAQRRKQRRRAVEAELAAEKRDRRSVANIRRADEADERWHRKALAARRRVSSEDARLAQLYRRAEWSSRALIAVVVLGMVWAGVNVQHNLVPSGDMTDPLYWLSYGIEAMISIPIITIMVAATTAARWGRELARGKVVFFETALLGTTIALNAGPHLASGSFGRAAEYAIAPVMVGVVIWLHAWVSARYALLIDGAPVLDRDATIVRHRVSDRDARVGLTVDAPDDRRWLLSGVDPYAATTTVGLPGAVGDVDRLSDRLPIDHAEPVTAPSTNEYAVRSFSADAAHPLAQDTLPSTNGHRVQASSASTAHQPTDAPNDTRPATNGPAVQASSADTAHQPTDAPNDTRPATNGHAVQARSADTAHRLTDDYDSRPTTNGPAVQEVPAGSVDRLPGAPVEDSRPSTNGHAVRSSSAETAHPLTDAPDVHDSHPVTNGHAVQEVSADNQHQSSPQAPESIDGAVAIPFSAINGHPLAVEPSDPHSAGPVANAHSSTNGHAVANGHAVTDGHSAMTNGHAATNGYTVGDDTSPTNGRPVNGFDRSTPTNGDNAQTNGHEVHGGRVAPTNGHAVTNGHGLAGGGRLPINGQPVNGTNRTPANGDTTQTNGHAGLNGHAMQLFPVNDIPRERTDPDTVAPASETTTDAHRGDEPEEPHTGDPIRKAAATIADTVAQSISGESASRANPARRKPAAPSVAETEVEQLVFDENPEPPRPALRTEPASIVARPPVEVEPELVDDEDEIDEDDEITALAHEITRRGMSNLSVEQLTQIFRLADESWLTPGIANEVGVSRAAVARAVEAGIKVRRPYAISG